MLRLLTCLALTLACAAPSRAQDSAALEIGPNRELRCEAVVDVGGQAEVQPAPGLRILDGPDDLSTWPRPAGLQALSCTRSSAIPDVRDDRVIRQLGVALYLTSEDPPMVTCLEHDGRGHSVQLIEGVWDETMRKLVLERVRTFNLRTVTPPD